MDSPYFMRFCFLLLTVATPCPNIAMPSDKRAEGTQNSSSSKTHVTAYYCKDRESNICKSSNYEGCDKIGETQNKEFSNEIIDLETNETHITMCFQQENTCPEGVYAIFWVKDVGMGDSCGILNSRENVNGSTIKICCEVEINLSVPNHLLMCYTKASDEKDRKSTADPISEENLGNPQFSISQNSSIGIITPLLIMGVGAALAVYCARRNRNRQGGENEQSTDIISVWEGDSISITCAMEGSENELAMYLRAIIQPINVVYVSKEDTSYIHPSLANRTEYSKEGRNLRITLHNVQESDSNIYLCMKYVISKGSHKRLDGKTTIVVVKAKTSGVVEQSPLYINPQQGQSINITCAFSYGDERIYLLKTHTQREEVLYVSSQNASTIHPAFAHRLQYVRDEKKIVITLHNLQKNDSDIYVCAGVVKKFPFLLVNGSGTMMLIKDAEMEQTNCSNNSSVIYGLTVVIVLLFSVLLYCTLHHVDMKKYFKKRKANTVYEDMSYSSRRNTLVRANTYSSGN